VLESQYVVNNLKMLPNGVMSEHLNVSAILCKENEILNLIQLLLNKGANINIKNGLNLTPILCILKSEIIRIDYFYNNAAKLLIQNRALMNVKSLIHAQTLEIAKLIIDKIDVYNVDNNNHSVLHNVLLTDESNVREEIIKILVEKDCKIVDESDIITLALDNNCNFLTIKTILQKYQQYNINSRGSCGNTILTRFCTDMDCYKMLVKLGADPTIVTSEGHSLLVTAIKLGNIDMVKILVNFGLNPLEYDNKFENNLSIICENLINENNTQDYLYKWTYLFKYFINLPHFNWNINKEKLFNFYSNLLNKLCIMYTNCKHKIRISRILYILFNRTNINTLIFNKKNINISVGSYSVCYDSGYDILSSMFIVDPLVINTPNDNYSDEFIHNMIDAGYSISKLPKHCITSLTVYLLYVKTETESQINLVKEIINQGVNIESNVLQLNSNTHLSYNALKSFKEVYYLPDVLLLSLLNDQEKLVQLFLNYWWGSPLSLLFFKNRSNIFEMIKWYNILAKYGGIPHGTRAFSLFYHFLAQWTRIVTTRPVEIQIAFIPVANHFQKLKSKY
jgi:ankyrin repeat protein